MSYYCMSFYIMSYRIISDTIISCQWYKVILYDITSYDDIISPHVIWYRTTSYHITSFYHIFCQFHMIQYFVILLDIIWMSQSTPWWVRYLVRRSAMMLLWIKYAFSVVVSGMSGIFARQARQMNRKGIFYPKEHHRWSSHKISHSPRCTLRHSYYIKQYYKILYHVKLTENMIKWCNMIRCCTISYDMRWYDIIIWRDIIQNYFISLTWYDCVWCNKAYNIIWKD